MIEIKGDRLTGGLAQWRQLARRQFCAKLNVITPQEVQWKPPLRKAGSPLGASEGDSASDRQKKVLN